MSSRARKTIDDELQKVEFETSEEVDVVPTFDSMGIREDLLRGIYAYGFEKPSAIQQRAIKQIIKGRDVIAQAQSGTGKTATFSISTLQVLDTSVRETQGKVLAIKNHNNLYSEHCELFLDELVKYYSFIYK